MYHENEQLAFKGIYKNGKRVGRWGKDDEDGKKVWLHPRRLEALSMMQSTLRRYQSRQNCLSDAASPPHFLNIIVGRSH